MNLRNLARDKQCMIRLPGCSFDNSETVLAHYRSSSTGMGQKGNDFIGAWACNHCHAIVDGRVDILGWSQKDIKIAFFEGIVRTQQEIIKHTTIPF